MTARSPRGTRGDAAPGGQQSDAPTARRSYGDLWRARIQMMRPANGVMAAVAVALGVLLVDPRFGTPLIAAPLAAFFITGFGNVLNDITDRDLDKTAHPKRPLPSGALRLQDAQAFAVLLLGFGLLEAWVAAGVPTLLFAAVNATLLLLYELRLKQKGLPGNLVVGLLVGSAFAFGAFATGVPWTAWGDLWALAGMAAAVNVARELWKDQEDEAHDRATRRTFPGRYGQDATRFLAAAFVLAAVALTSSAIAYTFGSGLPWYLVPRQPWSLWSLTALTVADGLFLYALVNGWQDAGRGQRLLKWAMVVALLAYGARVTGV